MPQYRVYYARSPAYVGLGSRETVAYFERTGSWPTAFSPPEVQPRLFTVERLPETHTVIGEVEAENTGQVYVLMQGEQMAPRMREHVDILIGQAIITHTSLTPGDVVEDVATGVVVECDVFGWRVME